MTTNRPRTYAEHPDDPTEGDWGNHFPYSEPGDWVALAEISHGAKALYYVYCGHVNKKKNGEWVWPSQATLANILRCTEKTVRKWIVELEHLGAIKITEIIDPRNGHKRLVVEVNQAAPAGYDGYTDYSSYYKDQKKLRNDVKGTLVEVAAATGPRTPPVKSTEGQGEKIPVDTDQAKHQPPVKNTEGQGPKTTEGQGPKTTGEETQDKKRKTRTHTPPPPESDSATEPETATGVCEEPTDKTPAQAHATAILKGAIDTTVARRMTGDERNHLVSEVTDLILDGWKPTLLAAQLKGRVDADTREPYGVLLKRCQAIAKDTPSAATGVQPDLWGSTDATTHSGAAQGPQELTEAAPGVVVLPNGERQLRYRACGDRYCTGGQGGQTGLWRRRINRETGDTNELCDTEITLGDGRTTTCHPDATRKVTATV